MAYKSKEDFNAWRRECRRVRRARALCVECGKDAVPCKRKCQECLDNKNKSENKCKKKRIQGRIKIGVCPDCPNQAEQGKRYCTACLDKFSRKYKEMKSRWCHTCHRSTPNKPMPGKTMCKACLDKVNARNKELRMIVLRHYGLKCNCPCGCGATNHRYLTIDHKNNDGAKHRREDRGYRGSASKWIIKNNFPDFLQVLCWNCNLAKYHYGGCDG